MSSDLGPLLHSWGVDFPANMVLLDRASAQQVAAGNDPREPSIAYPIWLHLTPQDFDPRDPVTASLQAVNLASSGEIAPMRGATTIFHTLIASSDQANMMDRAQLMSLRDPTHLIDSVRPTGVRYAMAARITGPAKTAFPNAPGAVQKGNVQLVIVADSDLWDDRFWVHVTNQLGRPVAEPFADNGAFILNAVENLTGSDDLISLRTRASSDRPFTVVQAMQADRRSQIPRDRKQPADQPHRRRSRPWRNCSRARAATPSPSARSKRMRSNAFAAAWPRPADSCAMSSAICAPKSMPWATASPSSISSACRSWWRPLRWSWA